MVHFTTLASTPIMLTLLISISSSLTTCNSMMMPSEQFLFRYLDDWISLINRTMSTITPMEVEEESVHPTNSISNRCFIHINYLLRAGRERKPWALKIFDSMGKPGSGIMEASLSFLGFYSECIEAVAPVPKTGRPESTESKVGETLHATDGKGLLANLDGGEPVFGGRYCLANLQLSNSAIKALQKLTGLSPSVLTTAHPRIGLCLPSTCSMPEIQYLANEVLSKLIVNSSLTISTCTEPPKSISKDIPAILVLSFFCLALLPIFVGTVYDCIQDSIRPRCNTSDSTEGFLTSSSSRHRTGTMNSIEYQMPCSQRHRLQSIRSQLQNIQHVELKKSNKCDYLLAFSIKRNVAKIFDTSDSTSDSIDIFHGLRFFMMLWIITGHSYSFAMQWLFFRNPKELQAAPSNVLSQVFANGTFSVDSFLFLSGFLVTRVVLKQMKKSGGKLDLPLYYIHRYLRMTPLMMVVIAFCATILKYMSNGPSWQESIVMYDSWCQSNWWLNALYLHNFINRENMCLSHTWYSAVDMQLYFIAPIILIPLYKRPKVGLTILTVILSGSMLFTCLYTIIHSLPAVPYMSDIISQESLNQYYGSIYIKPYTRLGPYLVGMALAYVMYQANGKFTLSRKVAWIGWTLSTVLCLATLFAMTSANNGHRPSDVFAGLYSSFSRVIWACSLSWMTLACCAGHGGILTTILSSKLWVPWSRLTYAAYIVHPVVMAVFYGSRQTSFEFSHSLMLYLSLGNLVVTYFISLILSVVFESPIVAVEKLLLSGRASTSSPKYLSSCKSSPSASSPSPSSSSSHSPLKSKSQIKRIDLNNSINNDNNNCNEELDKNSGRLDVPA